MSTEQAGPLSGPATFGSALTCAGADARGLVELPGVLDLGLPDVAPAAGELEAGELDAGELDEAGLDVGALTAGEADDEADTTIVELRVVGAGVGERPAGRTEFTVTVTTAGAPPVLDAVHPAEARSSAPATAWMTLVRNVNA